MSSGTHVDLDWAEMEAGSSSAAATPVSPGALNGNAAGGAYLSDEEILGIEPVGISGTKMNRVIPSEARNLSSVDEGGNPNAQRDSSGKDSPRNDNVQEGTANAAMPEWMRIVAADPQHGGEAQQLWREHQEFRAAFASPEEARAVKELLPGGVRDVLALRDATQSVERIDAAIFSGDARAQSEVVAELARANPTAFRAMFAEAAKVLAGMGVAISDGTQGAAEMNRAATHVADGSGLRDGSGLAPARNSDGRKIDTEKENLPGTQPDRVIPNEVRNLSSVGRGGMAEAQRDSPGKDGPRFTENVQRERNDGQLNEAENFPRFDSAAYASFERAANDAVARDVRGSISDTLARVMPEGVADGAARRVGEDIFNEVHRALAADPKLSEQVAAVLRDRRFGAGEQQRVVALLAGRAKQLVPSVARRVIGEWTSTVLNTARSKAARQAAAAARVDIAAPGGSLDSMPLRQMSAREVNYASMSDEQILGM